MHHDGQHHFKNVHDSIQGLRDPTVYPHGCTSSRHSSHCAHERCTLGRETHSNPNYLQSAESGEPDQLTYSPTFGYRTSGPWAISPYTGCFVGWELFQRIIGTFGLGPRARKGLELDPSVENVGKSQGKCENNVSGKKVVFRLFWSIVDHIAPKKKDFFPNVSYHLLYFPTLLSPCFHLFGPPFVFRFLVFFCTHAHAQQHTTRNTRHHTTTHHTPLKTGLFSAWTSRIHGANAKKQRDKDIKDLADLVTSDTSEGRGEEARTRQVVVRCGVVDGQVQSGSVSGCGLTVTQFLEPTVEMLMKKNKMVSVSLDRTSVSQDRTFSKTQRF